MVIERRQRDNWLDGIYPSEVGQFPFIACDDGSKLVALLTPNILEVRNTLPNGDFKYTLFRKGSIKFDCISGWKKNILGQMDQFIWRQNTPEEDANWAAREKELLQHEWVGKTMLMWVGERYYGIRPELVREGFRVEEFGEDERTHYYTTNAAWTRVVVTDGIKSSVHGVDISRQLTVKVIEGKYAGHEEQTSRMHLRVIASDLTTEERAIVDRWRMKEDQISDVDMALLRKRFDTDLINLMLNYGYQEIGDTGSAKKVSVQKIDVSQLSPNGAKPRSSEA